MSDNFTIKDASLATVTMAGNEVSSVQYQKVKLINSTAGSSTPTGVAADPLVISGNVTSNSANIATETSLAAINAKMVTGTDIGDVTINNAASNAVYTQHGKTLVSVTGTVSTDTDIVNAVSLKRIKVIAYSLISSSTSANTITFQSNATTALWTVPLQALTGTIAGANLATSAPSFLFATAAGEKLTLDVSSANNVTFSVTYFADDAT